MSSLRPHVLLHTEDQWRRAAHQRTSLHPETWAVQLAWDYEPSSAKGDVEQTAGGLAFDPWCRLYHSIPDEGQVERVLWAKKDEGEAPPEGAGTLHLFSEEARPALGDFSYIKHEPKALRSPLGLAVDDDGRLFIAENGAGRILVYDLWERRLIRKIRLAGPGPSGPQPTDLDCDGYRIYGVLDGLPEIVTFKARTSPRFLPLPDGLTAPSRLALNPAGGLYLLTEAGTKNARVIGVDRKPDDNAIIFERRGDPIDEPFASDLTFQKPDVLVVARRPDEHFNRYFIKTRGQGLGTDEMAPLKARGYDGRGIVRTPDDRIGFWTSAGFRHAVLARQRFVDRGRVTTFRLDSGEYQTIWGRLFIDACLPGETGIRIHCVTADEPPQQAAIARTSPENTVATTIHRPDLSPPMPPELLMPAWQEDLPQKLHRRETGSEQAWAGWDRDDPFETYETPVMADPGRYLWVTLELRGNGRATPRVKSVRAEYPAHDLLRRLPRVFSRDQQVADFLRRYLTLFEGQMGDLDVRAFQRHVLLDPESTPSDLLPWLAGFLGLVLDERWPTETKRKIIKEAICLFRRRGTVPGLKRFLELYLGISVIIIEHFRTRGLGGAIVGGSSALHSRAVVGAGFRVGGAVGTLEDVSASGTAPPADAFETNAHRFSIVIPASLDREQLEVVEHILETHRPAHTLYDICTVDAGMRVGVGLYAELTSIVGRTGGFAQYQLGGSFVGRGRILGRPGPGTVAGSRRLGGDSRVG